MILQALNQYYDRKSTLGDIAPFGFSMEKIPIVIELTASGKINQINTTDPRETIPQLMPRAIKKTSGIASNLLWENAEYALGVGGDDDKKSKERHNEFVRKIKSLPKPAASDKGVIALIKFLDNFNLDDVRNNPCWESLQKKQKVTFQLQGEACLICQSSAVIETIKNFPIEVNQGICLITGKRGPIARLHDSIKNVRDAQSSGASIVSFNYDSFESFRKKQGDNAPVSEKASFAYTTALNHLLRKGSNQHIQIGDASAVFWAEHNASFEGDFGVIFGAAHENKDDPDAYTRAIKAVFDSVDRGRISSDHESSDRFYVLGLSPNAARISVRFWQVVTVAEISIRIKRHFEYLSIIHRKDETPYLPLSWLLTSVAVLRKWKNIPPNLAGEVMRSILAGRPYPFTFLAAAVRRCKAERRVEYPRAAIIKACLNSSQSEEELKVALDVENINTAYRLGRLFSVLEKIQEEANPGINATIRDRYYGGASSNSVSVFPLLLKLKNHHLNKLEAGRKVYFERLMGEIISKLNPDTSFPASLSLQDQGRFAVGYYHQRQDFFRSKKTPDERQS